MSEIRINILDASRAINGTLHVSIADAVLAGLSADPETIEELEDSMVRFAKPANNEQFLAGFFNGVNEEPWDAGIVFVDLAARVFAAESSYSILVPEGEVQFHNGRELTEVWLPYRVTRDWLFFDSADEYKTVADHRRARRSAVQPLDARPVLYGAIAEFIANECRAARESNKEYPVTEIHKKWLMTPRNDLHGLPPREVLLMQREHIDWDMWSREMQWRQLKEPAPCLKKGSYAYRFAGFGTHEIVIYYNLIRMLITDCWKRMTEERGISISDEIARLEQLKAKWLDSPNPGYGRKTPSSLIELERIRLPWLLSEEGSPFEDDCPFCQTLANEKRELGFWHLDGCNRDNDFAFSFCHTREEWEAENRRLERVFKSIEQEEAQRNLLHQN
jgi:hypothetical protein